MRFRTAIIWNAISQFGQSGITLLSTVILSRILTPSDFGLIGIVAIFIAFSQMMVDSEMGGSLLRKKRVTNADYSTLFYYNLAVSLAIYALLYFSAPLIADFYAKPELTSVVRLLSLCIIIHAFRVVQLIMILRELKFKAYALINVASGLTALAAAVFMAKAGLGFRALVWQQIILAVVSVALMEGYNRFIPSLKFSRESFRYQFGFGISLLGANTILTIANNITANIIAKISTLQFTGYYTQSSRITNFCQNSLGALFNQSIFPLMAKFDTMAEVRAVYHRILIYVAAGIGGLSAVMVVFAEPLVRLALGENWLPAAWIFRILSIGILPAVLQVVCRNVMKTLGTTRHVLYLDSLLSVGLIALLIAAGFLGTEFLVWALVAAQGAGAVVWLLFTEKKLSQTEK